MQQTITKPAQDQQTAEWQTIRFGDVATVKSGYAFKSDDWLDYGIPVIKITNVKDGRIVLEGCSYVSPDVAQKAKEFQLRRGDILIAMTGYVGDVAVVRNEPEMVLNQRVGKFFIQKPDRLDSQFLFYFLRNPITKLEVENLGYGSAQANVSPTLIQGMKMQLPPIAEQYSIASILGSLDDKIELNRQIDETLEQTAQALFKSWFVDFDPVRAKAEGRDTGLPKEIANLFPDSFEDSELGDIPKGWRVGKLSDVAKNLRRGVQPEQIDSSTPYIGLEHMPRHCIALSDWDHASELGSNKFEFKRGEILFGKLRPYFHKVGVAPLDGVCSTDILVVAPIEKEWFGFALGHLSSVNLVGYTSAGSTGTKMPRTSWGEMARYPIVLPPTSIATIFTSFVDPSVEKIITNIHESKTVSAIRDLLLPKLLSGEIKVN